MLTKEEIKLVRDGYGHTVDNGYSKLETVADIIRNLEVSLEKARRERMIGKMWGIPKSECAGCEAIIEYLEATIRNLEMRTGA